MIKLLLGYGGIEGLAKSINIMLSLSLATFLTVSDYGIVATLIAIELVITEIILLGQNSFILRFFKLLDSDSFHNKYIASGHIILFTTILLMFVALIFPMQYFLLDNKSFIKLSLLVLIFGTFLQANVTLYLMYLRSFEKIKYYGFLRVSSQALKFIIALLLVYYFNNPLLYSIGILVSGFIVYFTILTLRTEYWRPPLFIGGRVEWFVYRENLKFSFPIAVHSLAGASYSIIDRIFLSQLADLDMVAVYNFAFIQGASVFFFVNILALTLIPKFYETNSFEERARNYLNKFLYYSISGMILLSLFIYYVVFPISLNFVPHSYQLGQKILPIIAFAMIANCASNYAVYKLTALKRVKILPVITLLSLGLNAGLNYILIPYFGIIGAAYALMFSEVTYAVLLNAYASGWLSRMRD